MSATPRITLTSGKQLKCDSCTTTSWLSVPPTCSRCRVRRGEPARIGCACTQCFATGWIFKQDYRPGLICHACAGEPVPGTMPPGLGPAPNVVTSLGAPVANVGGVNVTFTCGNCKQSRKIHVPQGTTLVQASNTNPCPCTQPAPSAIMDAPMKVACIAFVGKSRFCPCRNCMAD